MLKSYLAVVLLFFISAVTNALHFYLDAGQRRCFIEELPANTVAEGIYYVFFYPSVVNCVQAIIVGLNGHKEREYTR